MIPFISRLIRERNEARRHAERLDELAKLRLDAINHLTERNVGLRATNRRITAELATFHNARDRQIAQCRANASKGGKARAAKIKGN